MADRPIRNVGAGAAGVAMLAPGDGAFAAVEPALD
jgi:hypothetical protein